MILLVSTCKGNIGVLVPIPMLPVEGVDDWRIPDSVRARKLSNSAWSPGACYLGPCDCDQTQRDCKRPKYSALHNSSPYLPTSEKLRTVRLCYAARSRVCKARERQSPDLEVVMTPRGTNQTLERTSVIA